MRSSTRETKPCQHCGEQYSRHPDSSNKKWQASKYCSRECMGLNKRKSHIETRTCEYCNGIYLRKHGEGIQVWSIRRYCSKDCANKFRSEQAYSKLPETKACLQCGNTFRRDNNASATRWAKRRFCSPRCSALRAGEGKPPALRRPECGTMPGYWRHIDNVEQTCAECRQARRAYTKNLREAKTKTQLQKNTRLGQELDRRNSAKLLSRKIVIDGNLLVQLVDSCSDKQTLNLLDHFIGAEKIDQLVSARDYLTENGEPMNIADHVTIDGHDGTYEIKTIVGNYAGVTRIGERAIPAGEGTSDIDLAVTLDKLTVLESV